MPPVATTGIDTASTTAGSNANRPTVATSARSASNEPRWPPDSMPCATTTSAPAASAARASATVVTLANQAIPRAFMRSTNSGGYSPMIEDTMDGATSSNASHCAAKSGGVASPAVGGTSGPQAARSSRTRASCAGSRRGA